MSGFLQMQAADYEFMKWVTEYGKMYGTRAEFDFRLEQFKNTLDFVEQHNAKGEHTVGINEFAAHTPEEWKKMLGYNPSLRLGAKEPKILNETNLADEVDWRTKGAVTPVKNQGQCGSCWSFSTTGAVEGAMFQKTGKLQSFSEQQLVDCDKVDQGCNGGLMDNAFKYIESNPLMLEADYPYKARKSLFGCSYKSDKGVGEVKSYEDVSPSAGQLKAAIAKGPVSVAIEADQSAFQMYTSGVIKSGCGTNLDHGVLAVGYGTEDGTDYVLVKNSWGPSWGDKGYVKMAFNQCGVTNQPSYPTE